MSTFTIKFERSLTLLTIVGAFLIAHVAKAESQDKPKSPAHEIQVVHFCSLNQEDLVNQLKSASAPALPGSESKGYWIKDSKNHISKLEVVEKFAQSEFLAHFVSQDRSLASSQIESYSVEHFKDAKALVEHTFKKLNCKKYVDEKASVITNLFYLMWQ